MKHKRKPIKIKIKWPEIKLPPINLWNQPFLSKRRKKMTMDNGLDIPKDYIDNSYIILKLEELFNLTSDNKVKKSISALIKEIRRMS